MFRSVQPNDLSCSMTHISHINKYASSVNSIFRVKCKMHFTLYSTRNVKN